MASITGLLVAVLAMMHLAYALQNLMNPAAAHGAVRAVLGQEERPIYGRSLFPPVRHPWLTGLALAAIIALQLAAGIVLGAGAYALATTGHAGPASIGCGLALLLWFGLFLGIGAPLFQMWQTPMGQGAIADAFRNGTLSAVVLFLLRHWAG
jgi:predicted small integral membrane protein